MENGKQELLNSALDFDAITVGDIYTDIRDVIALDINCSCEEILQIIKSCKYSRLPVYKGCINNIIGILPIRNLLKSYIKHGSFNIESLVLEPYYVNENILIDDLLQEMSRKGFICQLY